MGSWRNRFRALLPRSVAARGAFVIVLTAVAIAGPGFIGHRILQEQALEAARAREEAFLALAVSSSLGAMTTIHGCATEPSSVANAERGTEPESTGSAAGRSVPRAGDGARVQRARLLELSRRVRWAGIVGADGAVLELCRREGEPLVDIAAQVAALGRAGGSRPLLVGGKRSMRYELLTMPQREADSVLAAVVDKGAMPPEEDLRVLFGCGLVAVTGLLLALAAFRTLIVEPIRQWRAALVCVEDGLAQLAGEEPVPGELAELGGTLEEMREELQRVRREAAYFRHSVAVQVDARTRRAERAQKLAEHAAGIDEVTQLANRRALKRDLPALFTAHKKSGEELSVVLFDVDSFKHLNDACGHQAGDELLAFVGQLLRGTIRKGTDLAVRYGGDEFVLVLPGTSASAASGIAERIIKLFAQRARTLGAVERRPALSAGVAAMREHGARCWEDLVRMADEAMYRAKEHKRGVVTVAEARDPKGGPRAGRQG